MACYCTGRYQTNFAGVGDWVFSSSVAAASQVVTVCGDYNVLGGYVHRHRHIGISASLRPSLFAASHSHCSTYVLKSYHCLRLPSRIGVVLLVARGDPTKR